MFFVTILVGFIAIRQEGIVDEELSTVRAEFHFPPCLVWQRQCTALPYIQKAKKWRTLFVSPEKLAENVRILRQKCVNHQNVMDFVKK